MTETFIHPIIIGLGIFAMTISLLQNCLESLLVNEWWRAVFWLTGVVIWSGFTIAFVIEQLP